MKLTKAEKWVLVLTLLFLAFTVGMHWGTRQSRDSFTITTQKQAPQSPAPAAEAPAEDTAGEAEKLVNINTADKETLMTLNGVGEKLAERIIQYREENGPFGRIEDITKVSGIGSGTYLKICQSITVE